jgi:hypothetical protein
MQAAWKETLEVRKRPIEKKSESPSEKDEKPILIIVRRERTPKNLN